MKRFTPIRFKEYIIDEYGNEREKEVILMFRLGPKAAHNFKAISGKSIDKLSKDELDIEEIVQLLYAGCMDMHKDLTLDKMWELVDNYDLEEFGNLMSDIFPQAEIEEEVPNAE
jgi:hypothetical protein